MFLPGHWPTESPSCSASFSSKLNGPRIPGGKCFPFIWVHLGPAAQIVLLLETTGGFTKTRMGEDHGGLMARNRFLMANRLWRNANSGGSRRNSLDRPEAEKCPEKPSEAKGGSRPTARLQKAWGGGGGGKNGGAQRASVKPSLSSC